MTRENKLALVVGFGLILFVGILISDHFSVVRSQAPADLTNAAMNDPLTAVTTATVDPVNLIQIKPLRSEPLPEAQPANDGTQLAANDINGVYENNRLSNGVFAGTLPQNTGGPQVTMGLTPRPGEQPVPEGFEQIDPAKANTAAHQFHDVQSGESLFAIAKQYYGTTDAIDALARFNRMDDPAAIRSGQRIRIPSAQELGLPGANGTASEQNIPTTLVAKNETRAETKPAQTKARVTYTVKKGETLRVIALKVLGSKEKWNKIYNLNRNVIDDPDNLKVGTVLRLS
jgi:nucleoid-associated protein YgaU